MSSSVARSCSTPVDGRRKVFPVDTAISEIGENSSSGAQDRRKLVFPTEKKKLRKRKRKNAAARKIVRSKKRAVLNDPDLKGTSDSQTDEPSKIIAAARTIYRPKKRAVLNDSALKVTSDSQADEPSQIIQRNSSNLSKTPRKRRHSADFVLFQSLNTLYSTTVNSTAGSLVKDPEFTPRRINDNEEVSLLKRRKTDGIRCYPPAPAGQRWPVFIPTNFNRNNNNTGLAAKHTSIRRTKFDTATSDMLWDDFVKKNPNTVGKYLENVRKRLSQGHKFFKSRISSSSQSEQTSDDRQRGKDKVDQKVRKRLPHGNKFFRNSGHSQSKQISGNEQRGKDKVKAKRRPTKDVNKGRTIIRVFSIGDTQEFRIEYDVE